MAVFNIAAFRAAFPAFASTVIYPDATIQSAADSALCFLSGHNCGCDTQAWQLATAHLLQLRANAASGTTGGLVTSASIDKVSVSVTPPPVTDGYSYWLSLSPYGLELLALLSKCSAGGFYVGGLPERAAFRNVGGIFPRGGRVR